MLTDTIGKFFRTKYSFFSQGDMGVLLNSFQQEVDKVGNTFGAIARLMATFLQALIFIVLPFSLSPKLASAPPVNPIFHGACRPGASRTQPTRL